MDGLITPIEVIDAEETLSRGLKRLEDSEMLIVTKEGKYFGELRPDVLIRFKGDADSVKVKRVARKGSIISERDASKFELIFRKFSKSGMKWIAVLNSQGKPIGKVHSRDVLRAVCDSIEGTGIGEYLEKVVTIDGATPADKAEELMAKNGVLELAVFEKGIFAGMLTARDLAVKVKPYLHKKMHNVEQKQRVDVEKEPILSILTPDFALRRVQSGSGVAESLRGTNFEEAYVFDGGRLRGKLSYFKILKGLELVEPAHIEVSGLTPEEGMFKESIFEECASLLRKFSPQGGSLHLRVKSSRKGREKKIYEVHGRLELNGMSFVASTPEISGHRENWDLGMAVGEVLKELKKSYLKKKR